MEADELPSRRPDPYRWQDHAACKGADPDLFFPSQGESAAVAKALCASCSVRSDCLEAGLQEPHGIWGGVSERARRRMRRTRPPTPRVCPFCEVTFQPRNRAQRYCCPQHTHLAAVHAHRERARRQREDAS